MKLIDKTWGEIARLHSIRTAVGGALFWSAIGGGVMVWPALADHIPLGFYVLGGIVLSAVFGAARVLKQPGAGD